MSNPLARCLPLKLIAAETVTLHGVKAYVLVYASMLDSGEVAVGQVSIAKLGLS